MDEQSRMLETQQDADQDNPFGMFGPFPITGKPLQQQQDMFSGGQPHKVNGQKGRQPSGCYICR